MTISQRLREAREQANISLTKLSEKTGVSRSSLQRYEKGSTEKIPLSAVTAVENALGLSQGYLMGWNDKEPPRKLNNIFIKQRLEELDLSYSQLATAVGLSLREVRDIIEGHRQNVYAVELLIKISNALDCDFADLFANSQNIRNSIRKFALTEQEEKLITAYREQPQMQEAVNKLLGI